MKIKNLGNNFFISLSLVVLIFLFDRISKIYVINLDKVSYASNFYNVKDFKLNKKYKFFKININNKQS